MYSTNHFRLLIGIILLALLTGCVGGSITPSPEQTSAAGTTLENTTQFGEYFQGFSGAFVLYDLNNEHYLRYNPKRCTERFLPASTFKIVNSLIGLETGVIRDENHVIEWDGTQYETSSWNQNHTLKTAFRNSVVWYYQELARRVGREKMRHYIDAVGYGNQDITGNIDSFWLDGAIRISADEQVELLKRLYQGELSFSPRSMEIVREIMILDDAARYRLSGKTGSGKVGTIFIGWFVGYVETMDNVYFFATNVENPGPEANGRKAKEITHAILKELQLLPADSVLATLPAPTAIAVVTPSPTATPLAKVPLPGTILFEEDFEDDVIQGLNYLIGSWEVVTDETGNKVFEADNRFEPETLSFGFGSPEWSDYAVDYDVRLRSPAAAFSLFFRHTRLGHYGQSLTVLYASMGLVVSDAEGNWWRIESPSYAFGRGVWYHMRVEAQGPMLRAFINGELHVEIMDSQFSAGEASFDRLAGRVQLDNIRVTVLPPYNAEEDLYQENLKGGATGIPLSPDGN